MAHIAESSVPRGIYTIYMKQFSPFLRNLGTGNNNSFTVDLKQYRRMSHIAIAFINMTNETFHMSPTDFSSGFSAYGGSPIALQAVETKNINDQLSNLYQIYITFAGIKYPMNDYTLLTMADNFHANDLSRAWYDYLLACDSLRDRSGNLLDFKSWQVSPIFLWKTFQDIKTTNNVVNVTVNCRSNATNSYSGSNTNVFLCGFYDEYYKMEFDDQARCIYETLSMLHHLVLICKFIFFCYIIYYGYKHWLSTTEKSQNHIIWLPSTPICWNSSASWRYGIGESCGGSHFW